MTFVFIHGFLGFEFFHPLLRIVPYFRGLAGMAGAMKASCIFPRLPAAASVAERSKALAEQLSELPAGHLTLVGHSMGGLDARYFAQRLDRQGRVRRIVTLGTPHRGTAIAESLLAGRGPYRHLVSRQWKAALTDLTREACERRNETLADRPDVEYRSYAGKRTADKLPCWLKPLAAELDEINDGLVPVSSASWGRFLPTLEADHFELVGWSLARSDRASGRPFPHLALYRSIIEDASPATDS